MTARPSNQAAQQSAATVQQPLENVTHAVEDDDNATSSTRVPTVEKSLENVTHAVEDDDKPTPTPLTPIPPTTPTALPLANAPTAEDDDPPSNANLTCASMQYRFYIV